MHEIYYKRVTIIDERILEKILRYFFYGLTRISTKFIVHLLTNY